MQMLVCLMLSKRPLKLPSFCKSCFSFCCSDWVISIILSSRSFIHSSVSPSLMLILLVYFSLQLLYSSTLVLFFTFSSSLLKFSLCSYILFPSSVSILVIDLNSFSGKLFTSLSLGFFSGFFLFLSFETYSPVFSFCLHFSISVKLHETVTYPSLEGVSLCGSFLCSLCVPTGFGGKAGSEVSTVTSSPRVCCHLSPWWETGLEMEGLEL